MQIKGVEWVSWVDYPGQICTTVFYDGCNLRCPFCHNALLVWESTALPPVDQAELLKKLGERRELVPAVCISGGEPTLSSGLPDLVMNLKSLGLKIKLDTNGTRPKLLKKLLADGLLDYVAMDIKSPWDKYRQVVGTKVDVKAVQTSVKLLTTMAPAYEFRTTVVPGLLNETDLLAMGQELAGASKYVLQQFRPVKPLLDPDLEQQQPFPKEFLQAVAAKLHNYVAEIEIRG